MSGEHGFCSYCRTVTFFTVRQVKTLVIKTCRNKNCGKSFKVRLGGGR